MAGELSRTRRSSSGPRANSRGSISAPADVRRTARPAPPRERTNKRAQRPAANTAVRIVVQRNAMGGSIPAPIEPALDPMHNRRLAAARELTRLTPFAVVGAIAVHIHGARSTTTGVMLYVPDADDARAVLERVGLKSWLSPDKFALAGVEVALATPTLLGRRITTTQVIDGVRVPALAELISILLTPRASADSARCSADALGLIRTHNLDKRFASRLAAQVQPRFKSIVDSLRAGQEPDARRSKKD